MNDWLQQVNDQYLVLNQLSASFAWDLIVDPNSHIYDEASELGKHRSKWQIQRCAEAQDLPNDSMTEAQKRMIWILCRGPKYTEYQGGYVLERPGIFNLYKDLKFLGNSLRF